MQSPKTTHSLPIPKGAICSVDKEWRITAFNASAEALTGLVGTVVVGKHFSTVFNGNDTDMAINGLIDKLDSGRAVLDFRMVYTHPVSAETLVLLLTAIPIPDNGGHRGAVIALHDAGDPRLIYRLVINSIADGIFTIDRRLRITSFNRAAELITGWSREEVVGKSCHDFFDPETYGDDCLLPPNVDENIPATNRLIFVHNKNGRIIPTKVSTAPLLDQDDHVIGGVVTFRDATDTMEQDLILQSIADGVFAVDRDMRITAFNQAAEQISGWKAHEVIGLPCSEVFHSSICGAGCILANSVQSGEPTVATDTVFVKGKDGRTIPISISAAPLLDPEGNVIGGVETFRDVTATMEHDIILDSIADGVFAVDRDMRITAFNRAAEQISGWSTDEVIGMPCSEIFHSSICGEGCLLACSVKSCQATISQETVFVKGKDGSTIPISISAAPLLDPEGNVIGGVETFRDVTAAMQQNLVLDSIADGVFTVDRNWRITSFNRAAEMITGWPRGKAIGQACSEVFHSSICGDNCAIAQSMYSGRPVANRSIFIRTIEGEKVPISISAAPLLDHEGNVIGGVETFRDLSALDALRRQLTKKYTFGEILSKSASMQRIFTILPEIAHSESNVLVLGESGTGKELIARATHNASTRHKGPFVVVNCGALPETLLESELFGYKAGAFTDAKQDRFGRFAAAEKGTLFLDEIGDIPASLQVKLLRVLQNRVYEPLGSSHPVKADVRIVAATNRDLQALVQEGLFREDLFYRLNVVKIHLPPLRDRMEDIPMLTDHFIKQFSAQQGKDIVGMSAEALDILMRHHFPGNIRELENIIEYAFILCHGGFIQPEHLPEPFTPKEKIGDQGISSPEAPQTLENLERQAIYRSLERNHWKRMATCRELGISKDTLRRKIERYDLAGLGPEGE